MLVVVTLLAVLALTGDDDGDDPPAAALSISMVEMAFVPDPDRGGVVRRGAAGRE